MTTLIIAGVGSTILIVLLALLLVALVARNHHNSHCSNQSGHLPVVCEPSRMPARAHEDDAGLDLRADCEVFLRPGQRFLMPTGVRMRIPHGHVGLVCPRSGLAMKHGISIVNAPGVVDAGYTGEVKVNLVNLGERAVMLRAGERIAQLVIVSVDMRPVRRVERLLGTGRGDKGHGSTGVK